MSLPLHLPIVATIAEYERLASALLKAFRRGDAGATEVFRNTLPRFLDPVVTWKPLPVSDDEMRAAPLTDDDARMAVARAHTFRDWNALEQFAVAMAQPDSPVNRFELAAESVIDGDAVTLRRMLAADPTLVGARSSRECCLDPAVHRASLLHYTAANGVEGYRQRSAPNAVEVATLLLDAGAEVDALADMYGGACTTLSMLVSSTPPARAGVQVPLVELLLDRGASVTGRGDGSWVSPIRTALIFGFLDAAAAIAKRAGAIDDITLAAGLGRAEECARLLAVAPSRARQEALALAVTNHQHASATVLLEAGVDPNAFNPPGMHAHQTPLHGAALDGDLAMVSLLVSYGARFDIPDTLWNGTAVGWADHGGHPEVVAWFAARA